MTTQLVDLFMRIFVGQSRDELRAVEFVSPMPLDECCRRLRARIDDTKTSFNLTLPVVGRFVGTGPGGKRRFICYWKPEYWSRGGRSKLKTPLSVELTDQSRQTRITCRVSINPGVSIMILVAGMLALVSVVIVKAGSTAGAPAASDGGPLGALVIMLYAGAIMVRSARYQARCDRQALLAFVRETLMADPA
jgi:hypothetical protein